MTAIENMSARLNYNGGANQVARMNSDKLRSLKKALLYSYQSATALLADGREFRCLINPDKLKKDYDNKIISIPFEDICLNSTEKKETTTKGIEPIGLKSGDIFTWKENNTDWIVFLQRLEETAYFRAEIRRCQFILSFNNKEYKVYASGPSEDNIDWQKAKGINWNDLNYSLVVYIQKNEETEEYLKRFSKVKINNKNWEVQATDSMSLEGIIILAVKEDYSNTIEDELKKEENAPDIDINPDDSFGDDEEIYISGDTLVYPFDEKTYFIEGTGGGIWQISNTKKAKILNQDSLAVKIAITTGRSGNFELIYTKDGQEDIVLPITIDSL